ncbi:arsenate-mycothiol transferase ArsC [Tenacibaculum amylolyticum]|uniref:arsenate-mycothiol transferase ArsC n=1 Tax=Tenacibaculum amylolyticum TaxID=104269 RepID=UPI0038963ED1
MKKELITTIEQIANTFISKDRKVILDVLINHLKSKLANNDSIAINFICTHNSRRSHLGQIWMQTLAAYFQIDDITTYSGGSEATAMATQIVTTLTQQGFDIHKISEEPNPVYAIKYTVNALPIIGFSKKYEHPYNPNSGFTAIMTCSQADEGCPFVAGSEKRIAITYEDPKLSDGTNLEKEVYLQRSNQIAAELYYVLSQLK